MAYSDNCLRVISERWKDHEPHEIDEDVIADGVFEITSEKQNNQWNPI